MSAGIKRKRNGRVQQPENTVERSGSPESLRNGAEDSASDEEQDEFNNQLDEEIGSEDIEDGTESDEEDANSVASQSDADDSSDEGLSSNTTSTRKKSKRNDSSVFADSISAILGSKLTTSKRADPVLSRSATTAEANASIANARLETKARQKLRNDKKEALAQGRVKDVLLGSVNSAGYEVVAGSVGQIQEEERRLRKTAQRGVVRLFNAIGQAQFRAEEARRQPGTRRQQEERAQEMTKQGFLEMVASQGAGAESKSSELQSDN